MGGLRERLPGLPCGVACDASPGILAPRAFGVETGTVATVYSLMFAACGGFVFYTSVRPVPMPSGVP